MAPVGAGEVGLLLAADGADHGSAQVVGPLAQDQADAAGGGMDQDHVAGRDRIGPPQQVARRHPFQHHGGSLVLGDPFGRRQSRGVEDSETEPQLFDETKGRELEKVDRTRQRVVSLAVVEPGA